MPKPVLNNNDVKKKKAEPSKRIDLGAAANYKGDSSSITQQAAVPVSKSSDLLDDLFSISPTPPASATIPVSNVVSGFADFSQLQSSQVQQTAHATSLAFADFDSAFISEPNQQTVPVQQVPSFAEDFMSTNPFAARCLPATHPVAANLNPVFPVLPSPMNVQSLTLLEPSQANSVPLVPNILSAANNNVASISKKELTNTTWSNLGLDIDLDNLLTRDTKTVAPSMNQLAADVGRISMNQAVLQPRTISPAFGGKSAESYI